METAGKLSWRKSKRIQIWPIFKEEGATVGVVNEATEEEANEVENKVKVVLT